MKKLFIVFSLVGFFAICCYYAFAQSNQCEAKAGCCSRHGGVSRCGNDGYYVCNDGTSSPSCKCY